MPASSRWSEFRERGGWLVVAQFTLMAGITLGWLLPGDWPDSVRVPLTVVGVVLIVLGVAIVVWARRSLGNAFTPLTTPPAGARRVETGPYLIVRHPMYTGALLLFTGLSLLLSIASLVLTGALAVLWRAKSAAEERALTVRFPDYAGYRMRTPRRFLPGIY